MFQQRAFVQNEEDIDRVLTILSMVVRKKVIGTDLSFLSLICENDLCIHAFNLAGNMRIYICTAVKNTKIKIVVPNNFLKINKDDILKVSCIERIVDDIQPDFIAA